MLINTKYFNRGPVNVKTLNFYRDEIAFEEVSRAVGGIIVAPA